MNTEFFIAKKIINPDSQRRFSKPIVRISIIGIALGLIVMILTIAISNGFKDEIRKRISVFGAHIIITNIGSDNSWESSPISKNQDFLKTLPSKSGIKSINEFAFRSAILKTDDEVHGVILKGVGSDYNWADMNDLLMEGKTPIYKDSIKSNEILISSQLSNILRIKPGDKVRAYFIQNITRQRMFTVSGVYENSLEDFNNLIFCDLGHIRKVNNWDKDKVGGFEIRIENFNKIEEFGEMIADDIGFNFHEDGTYLSVTTIKQKYFHLFDWLAVVDTNTWVILFLMIVVAAFNMISGLLILILERTNMIGTLKAMGSPNWNIRKIFLYYSIFLIGKGMLWGNIIGIGFCLAQQYFGFITLDPESYYVSMVPIDINFWQWLFLNLGTFFLTLSSLIVPSYIIARMDPAKVIRFQ